MSALVALPIDDAAIAAAVLHYRTHGWARLGKLADEATLDALRGDIDKILASVVVRD